MNNNIKIIEFNGVALEETCPECNGKRYCYNPLWDEYKKALDNRVAELMKAGMTEIKANQKAIEEMDYNNPASDYYYLKGEPEEYTCIECEGRGVIPTKEGLILLEFMKKYW